MEMLRLLLAGALASVVGCTALRSSSPSFAGDSVASVVARESGSAAADEEYPLDETDRSGPPKGKRPTCSTDDIVAYRGTTVRFEAPASVHRAFVDRLARFEKIVEEVGIEVYGRKPAIMHHAGGYMCRTSWRGRMSEHAFGNALDVGGFSFKPIGKTDLARSRERGLELPASARRAFRIDVGDTWRDGGKPEAKRFFSLLLERTRAERDLFRGMIGPPDPSHTTHLHLDAGPWTFSRYASPL